jgi:hypothetical protein
MRQLIAADILIMSKSSVSYAAASFEELLYEPFWHSPPDDWIVRDAHGIDRQRF